MKVAIVGYGVEGKSAETYWRAKGDDVTICDTSSDLSGYDLLVRSPGVHPKKLPAEAKVTSVTNEFMAQCPAPIISVTGTKGKGTTVSLIAEMLKNAGKTVHVAGNIGVPALDLLPQIQPDDLVVLELSSFQLMDAKKSPQVAVCLMIAPEHLDYHSDEVEYWDAKGNIFAHQKSDDVAIYNKNNQQSMDLAYTSGGTKTPYDVEGADTSGAYVADEAIWYQDTRICAVADVALLGRHNLHNICAAVAASWTVTQDVAAIAKAIKEFRGLPYRLQEVGVVNGVRYINDSISTTPESAIAAIQAFAEPKVMILGGSNKGVAFTDMAQIITASNITGVVLIGQTADQIAGELGLAGYPQSRVARVTSMTEAVQQSVKLAEAGSVILLSPACASFDMFTSYKDRGDQFNAAVAALA
jgi:UDP-N-acetylmuramoylalanine--D-glutamate ligase